MGSSFSLDRQDGDTNPKSLNGNYKSHIYQDVNYEMKITWKSLTSPHSVIWLKYPKQMTIPMEVPSSFDLLDFDFE